MTLAQLFSAMDDNANFASPIRVRIKIGNGWDETIELELKSVTTFKVNYGPGIITIIPDCKPLLAKMDEFAKNRIYAAAMALQTPTPTP